MASDIRPELHTELRIERMRQEDAETVAELDKRCFPTPWSLSAYLTEVHNPSGFYVVAKCDGRIVGYAGMWLILDEVHITTIGVDPDFRGRKIGERLLLAIIEEGLRRGARRATLEVRRNNTVAQNLYTKYGFRTVAIRKGYYTNNNEDAFVMWVDDMWQEEFRNNLRAYKQELEEAAV